MLASAWNAAVGFTCLRASRCCFQGFLEEHLCECLLGSEDVLMSPNGPRMVRVLEDDPAGEGGPFPQEMPAHKRLLCFLPLCLQFARRSRPSFHRIHLLRMRLRPNTHSQKHTHTRHTPRLPLPRDKLIGCCGSIRTQRAWLSTNSAGLVGTACVSMETAAMSCR